VAVSNYSLIVVNYPKKYIDVSESVVHCNKANTDFVLSAVQSVDVVLYNEDNRDFTTLHRHIIRHCVEIYNTLNPQMGDDVAGSWEAFDKAIAERFALEKEMEYKKLGILREDFADSDVYTGEHYTTEYVTHWSTSPMTLAVYLLSATTGILLLFFAVQRIFYYVVFGKLKPPKGE